MYLPIQSSNMTRCPCLLAYHKWILKSLYALLDNHKLISICASEHSLYGKPVNFVKQSHARYRKDGIRATANANISKLRVTSCYIFPYKRTNITQPYTMRSDKIKSNLNSTAILPAESLQLLSPVQHLILRLSKRQVKRQPISQPAEEKIRFSHWYNRCWYLK